MNISADKQQLQRILEQHEYTVYHQASGNSLWAWIKKLLRQLWDLLPPLHLSNGAGETVTSILAFIVLALLSWTIYWFVKQIVRQGRYNKKLELSDIELTWAWHDYLLKAEAFHSEGAWREGVRYVFLGLLFYLHEKEWVSIEKWKTNGEYGEELKSRRGLWMPLFQGSAKLFDQVWYGKAFIDEAGLRSFLDEVQEMIRDSEGGTHAPVE